MQLKTILNRITDYKSFVFGQVTWLDDGSQLGIEVEVRARRNGRPICSGCGRPAPTYDHSPQPRRFEFVPLWGMLVHFVYRMRRVNCGSCGVKVERLPWAQGKCPTTIEYQWYLARWARRMSWKEVAEAFRVSWDRVYGAVKQAVSWGLMHRDLSGIESIGVDEVQWHRGPRVSNGRVPTRRGLQAIVVDRSRPDGQDAAAPASAGWGENEPRRSNSSAATCGGRT